MKILSIQIPTVVGREIKFQGLYNFIKEQIITYQLQDETEVIYLRDNKEISIGAKRQKLYGMANALYSVQLDDDDWTAFMFCENIVGAIKQFKEENGAYPDCVGYIEDCTINGRKAGNSLFSIGYPDWIEKLHPQVHGCVRVRTPFFKTPIKTELCLQVGVKDMRFGEDHDFARRILPLLETQAFIAEPMYLYRHITEGSHKERYGIK